MRHAMRHAMSQARLDGERRPAPRAGRGIRRRGSLTFGAAAMGVVTASVGVVAPPAWADDYPSWNEVQQAKQDVTKQQALVDQITGLVHGLQGDVDRARVASGQAAEAYLQAKDALDRATKRVESLQRQADAAAKQAATSKLRAGLLAAHLAKSTGGGVSLDLLLHGGEQGGADDLLYQLGALTKLTEHSHDVYEKAITDKNTAQSLSEQADAARTERSRLAEAATSALQTARDAESRTRQALADKEKQSSELVAQLAVLKDTSVEAEREYLQGEAERAAREAAEKAAQEATRPPAGGPGSGGAGSGGSGDAEGSGDAGGSGGGPAAPPNANAVQTALNYAYAQLGEPYLLGAAGPGMWDCSGLTMMAYRAAGVDIGGHGSTMQFNAAARRGQLVPYSQRQPGDLIFWGSPGSYYHVAISLGGDRMIAAPQEGDVVKVSYVWGTPWYQVARPTL